MHVLMLLLCWFSARADDLLASFLTQVEATDYQTSVVASCDFPFSYLYHNTEVTLEWEVWTPDVGIGERGWIYKSRHDWVNVSTVRVLAGQMNARCDGGAMYLDAAKSAVITTAGAGGLDTGSEAASTWYSVWVIRQRGTANHAVLLSTSQNSPVVPSPYDMRRLVGWVYNTSGSNFRRFSSVGNGSFRQVSYDTPHTNMQALTAGTATTATTILLTDFVPPTGSVSVTILVTTNAVSGVDIRWKNSQATYARIPALSTQVVKILLPGGSGDDIEYQNLVAAGSTDVYVLGYEAEL